MVANPASVYCIEIGGTLEIRKDGEGNEVGYCKLPDGSEVEEWELFRTAHAEESKSAEDRSSQAGQMGTGGSDDQKVLGSK
ncbi:hypothetical protein BD324DRAFT_579295 [Kockovaella imperatae]|uniref:DUF333 domain-containing protein n=1 Tax=Kockovaella imperatae TaxID=4999 RepID=A0A1Y1UH90_9TREE|nr:hypothetical protein BD324DRAFT_579295 [Kockovaella imperatae]ORX37418.1 hypothetical protein BD324DRAFT_579295 [Kockovaella imperatae]